MREFDVLPRFVRKSQFRKYALVLLLLVGLMVGYGFYTQERVGEELTRNQHGQLQMTAEVEAKELGRWIDANENRARMLSEHRGLQTDDPDEADRALLAELGQLPSDVYAIHYVDIGDGSVVRSTASQMETKTLSDADVEWVGGDRSMSQSTDVAMTEVYRNGGLELVGFLSPVPGTDRGVMVVLDATQHAKAFREPVEGTRTQVVRTDGTVLLDRYGKNVLTQYRESETSPGLDAANEDSSLDGGGVVERSSDDRVVAYAPVGGTDWVVLVQAPRENVFAILTEVQTNLVGLIGAAVFGFVVVGLTLGRSTVVSLRRLRTRADRLSEGDLDVDLTTRKVDEFGSLYAAFDEMRESLRERIRDSEETASALERAATEYGETMDAAAEGDLTVRMDADAAGDAEAMATVGRRFNAMMDELEATMAEVANFADRAAAASARVDAGAREVTTASEQVSRSTQEISDGSADQLDALRTVSDEMSELSATVEEIAASTDELSELSERAATRGDDGREAAMAALSEMEAIESRVETATERVRRLDDEVADIETVVGLIDGIAEQTNILALNAQIEAARAGEAGEGFAVVAESVKDLAAETAAATDDIASSIDTVRDATEDTVSEMDAMSERVDDGASTIAEGAEAIRETVDTVEDVDVGVQSIDDATDSQASSTQDAAVQTDDAAGIAEQTHAEAERVAAAARQQTASMDTVADEIDTLSERTHELVTLVEGFDVDCDGDGGAATGETDSEVTADATTALGDD
ncbi:methyl-accepting chemotaxis protein [Halopelagius inordinatus]|uniref:Methyl-accepting chemotaxis protein n=1 Tax=Halopelagius inordinatus TaxID=553467 RepID=A0A1I2SWB8_9EURY|nr:methyl-accepting chemotaxis protein [Halopelagius inordinatus]SFG57024.1 methyl-accepting chemotaxis protein [Halopelagius inordinatus]